MILYIMCQLFRVQIRTEGVFKTKFPKIYIRLWASILLEMNKKYKQVDRVSEEIF